MVVSLDIMRDSDCVARILYRPGFFVEIQVAKSFRTKTTVSLMCQRQCIQLCGYWYDILDKYFNEWIFESRSDFFSEEQSRTGSAREHKSLFLTAARSLEKDLTPHGYRFKVSFE